MIGRISQRKAVQRLSGGVTAAAVLVSALGFSPAGALVLGRLNADGFGGPVSGAALTNPGGVTVPSKLPDAASVSPDGNWLIVGWVSGATPATQLYRRAGAKAWAYYGALPSVPTVEASNEYALNFPFVFSASSDRLTFGGSGPSNKTVVPIYWTLSGGVWTYQGNMPNMAGGFGYTESADGLLRLQIGAGASAFIGNYNGTAINFSIAGGATRYYVRNYLSPLGTYAVSISYYNTNTYVYAAQRAGASFSQIRDIALGYLAGQYSAPLWLSESVVAFGLRPLSSSQSTETVYSNLILYDLVNNTRSTITVDTFIKPNAAIDAYYDGIVDVFLVSSGVIGYVTVKGVIGTATFAGTAFTGLGTAIAIKQPALAGVAILRVP